MTAWPRCLPVSHRFQQGEAMQTLSRARPDPLSRESPEWGFGSCWVFEMPALTIKCCMSFKSNRNLAKLGHPLAGCVGSTATLPQEWHKLQEDPPFMSCVALTIVRAFLSFKSVVSFGLKRAPGVMLEQSTALLGSQMWPSQIVLRVGLPTLSNCP